MPESSLLRVVAIALVTVGAVSCGPSGDSDDTFNIVFALSVSPDDLDSLSFKVGYENGSFAGNGADASCTLVNNEDGETADFVDDDHGTLTIDIDASEHPLVPASNIVKCSFVASGQPTSADFAVTVLAAKDDTGVPVNLANVGVVVTSTEPFHAATLQGSGQ